MRRLALASSLLLAFGLACGGGDELSQELATAPIPGPAPTVVQGSYAGDIHNQCLEASYADMADTLVLCTQAYEQATTELQRAEAIYTRGFAHFERGEINEATRDYKASLDHDHPRAFGVWFDLGLIAEEQGDRDAARGFFKGAKEAIDGDPANKEHLMTTQDNSGRTYYAQYERKFAEYGL
jgi:tetratricopeptide (TPR) repeat protein